MKEIQTQRINTYLDALRAYPPEREALITENERYTFGELIEAAEHSSFLRIFPLSVFENSFSKANLRGIS